MQTFIVEYRDADGWTFDEVAAPSKADAAERVEAGRVWIRPVRVHTQAEFAAQFKAVSP